MIQLAVENNLDVEVQRYQLSIAGTDVLRAKGGGIVRGLPLTVQETPVGIGGPGGTLLNQAAAAGAVSPTPSTVSNVFDVNQLAEAQYNLSVQGNIPFSTGPALPVYDPNFTGTLAWVRREPAAGIPGILTPDASTDRQHARQSFPVPGILHRIAGAGRRVEHQRHQPVERLLCRSLPSSQPGVYGDAAAASRRRFQREPALHQDFREQPEGLAAGVPAAVGRPDLRREPTLLGPGQLE